MSETQQHDDSCMRNGELCAACKAAIAALPLASSDAYLNGCKLGEEHAKYENSKRPDPEPFYGHNPGGVPVLAGRAGDFHWSEGVRS
jgi:hypothetical protein